MKSVLKLVAVSIFGVCCFGSEAMGNDYWIQFQQLHQQYRLDVARYANDPVALQQIRQRYQQDLQQLNQAYQNWRNRH